MNWKHVPNIRATFTIDSSDLTSGLTADYTPERIIDYLNESPRNAIVLHNAEWIPDDHALARKYSGTDVYIIRGAGGGPDDFYYGMMPREDHDGVYHYGVDDLDAESALVEALDLLLD